MLVKRAPLRVCHLAALLSLLPVAAMAGKGGPFLLIPVVSTEDIGTQPAGEPWPLDGWTGLVCTDLSGRFGECELRAFTLTPSKVELAMESLPTPRLRAIAGGSMNPRQRLLVLAHPSGVEVSRKPVTWFNYRTARAAADETNGSLGVTIHDAGEQKASFLPRWDPNEKRLTFYIEGLDRRQPLGRADVESLEQQLKVRDLLLWAGDLDGDDRIDVLTQLPTDLHGQSTSGAISLWLSSQSTSGELLGHDEALSWSPDMDIDEGEE